MDWRSSNVNLRLRLASKPHSGTSPICLQACVLPNVVDWLSVLYAASGIPISWQTALNWCRLFRHSRSESYMMMKWSRWGAYSECLILFEFSTGEPGWNVQMFDSRHWEPSTTAYHSNNSLSTWNPGVDKSLGWTGIRLDADSTSVFATQLWPLNDAMRAVAWSAGW